MSGFLPILEGVCIPSLECWVGALVAWAQAEAILLGFGMIFRAMGLEWGFRAMGHLLLGL